MSNIEEYLEEIKLNAEALTKGKIPQELRLNRDFLLDAIAINREVYFYIPDSFKTKEFFSEAIERNGEVYEFGHPQFQTRDLALKAVKQNGFAVEVIGLFAQDKEVFDTAYIQIYSSKKFLQGNFSIEGIQENYYDLPIIVRPKLWDSFWSDEKQLTLLKSRIKETASVLLTEFEGTNDELKEYVKQIKDSVKEKIAQFNTEQELVLEHTKKKESVMGARKKKVERIKDERNKILSSAKEDIKGLEL